VQAAGTTIVVTCNENVNHNTDAGWAFTSDYLGTITTTYASGDGGTALTYNLQAGRTIYVGEVISYVYTASGTARITDTSSNALASIGSTTATNSSSTAGPTPMFCDGADCHTPAGFESPWNPATPNYGNWGGDYLTPVLETTIKAKGSVSQKTDVGATFTWTNTLTARTEIWVDFWVYLASTAAVNDFFKWCGTDDADAGGKATIMRAAIDNVLTLEAAAVHQSVNYTISDATWTHMWLHFTHGADNGVDVLQFSAWKTGDAGTGDIRPAWLYDTPVDMNRKTVIDFSLGSIGAATDVTYTDALRAWYGPNEPAEWR
jgi:hypothetical protein